MKVNSLSRGHSYHSPLAFLLTTALLTTGCAATACPPVGCTDVANLHTVFARDELPDGPATLMLCGFGGCFEGTLTIPPPEAATPPELVDAGDANVSLQFRSLATPTGVDLSVRWTTRRPQPDTATFTLRVSAANGTVLVRKGEVVYKAHQLHGDDSACGPVCFSGAAELVAPPN